MEQDFALDALGDLPGEVPESEFPISQAVGEQIQQSEQIKEEVVEEQITKSDQEVKDRIELCINSKVGRKKAWDNIREIRKNLGIRALENKLFKPTNDIEELFHDVRWERGFLESIGVLELCSLENMLAAHIIYIQTEKNKNESMYRICEQEFERAVSYACLRAPGKTITERKAYVKTHPSMVEYQDKLEIFLIANEQYKNIVDTLILLDQSLKRDIDIKRDEMKLTRQ
jgi:hypothetical protein